MCTWKPEDQPDGETAWATECQNRFVFITGTPTDNDFNYCPYCGDVLHSPAEQVISVSEDEA